MDQKILRYFHEKDPFMYRELLRYPDIHLTTSNDHFIHLLESIVSQQLSMKAADTIWKRFRSLFSEEINPITVTSMNDEKIRSAGLSGSKIRYVKNVATAFLDKTITPERFTGMTDEEVIAQLVCVKGIGRWTAEMFLIFSLGREDIFSFGDAGLRKAINRLYRNGKKQISESTIRKIVLKWTPYRSIASLALWKTLDSA
jgi:DNA-3-methyladenine glycosylase II